MLQLHIHGGKREKRVETVRKFPLVIGRGASCDLRIQEPGVWDRHLEIRMQPNEGFEARVLEGGLASQNGAVFQEARIRAGDLLEFGSVKIQVFLSEINQRSLKVREAATWVALALLPVAQIALILWLPD